MMIQNNIITFNEHIEKEITLFRNDLTNILNEYTGQGGDFYIAPQIVCIRKSFIAFKNKSNELLNKEKTDENKAKQEDAIKEIESIIDQSEAYFKQLYNWRWQNSEDCYNFLKNQQNIQGQNVIIDNGDKLMSVEQYQKTQKK